MSPEPRSSSPALAPAPGTPRDNVFVADRLREMALLLQAQGDVNPFRAAAYRRAADTVAGCERSMQTIMDEQGLEGLDALPGVGPGIASAIAEIVHTGHWSRLDRLRGAAGPELVFRTIPGIGPQLALQIHDELGVETLEALETAAYDGRLEALPGIGVRRAAAIRAALTQMLDRSRRARQARPAAPGEVEPAVVDLLEVDHKYRSAAAEGKLPKIAPRRFNPSGEASLPVLHTRLGDWAYTALFSNTARAHELGRARDWVVVYAEDRAHHERQYTVVTATHGRNAGRRVVRGREIETPLTEPAP